MILLSTRAVGFRCQNPSFEPRTSDFWYVYFKQLVSNCTVSRWLLAAPPLSWVMYPYTSRMHCAVSISRVSNQGCTRSWGQSLTLKQHPPPTAGPLWSRYELKALMFLKLTLASKHHFMLTWKHVNRLSIHNYNCIVLKQWTAQFYPVSLL